MSRTSWRVLALAALAATCRAPPAVAAGFPPCGELFVADAEADPGTGAPFGAVLGVDADVAADENTVVVGGTAQSIYLSHVAVAPGRIAYLSDLDADPSGLGDDPNGNAGRGAVFVLDGATGATTLVADGTRCGAGISACGPAGVFVDPTAVAWRASPPLLVLSDLDADPSGLGPDTLGFAGHGAVFSVDPSTGMVDLISDGSRYPAGIPSGRPSIFEDPVGLAFAPDGSLYVVDQLADPLATGNTGALFRVNVATGDVTLVSAMNTFVGLRDVAVEPAGTVLVLDRLAGTSGTLFRIEPALPPNNDVVATFSPLDFVQPAGLVVAGNGRVFVLDTAADPMDAGTSGAVFAIDAGLTTITVVSSTADFAVPTSLDLAEALSVDAATPPSAGQGEPLTVTLTGGVFAATPAVDFGPAITVDAVRLVSGSTLDVDITIAGGAAIGFRDVRVTNPDATQGLHCALFEVTAGVPCDDMDGDGFGSPGTPTCPRGSATDCDDGNASIYPGAPELCDNVDNDCDRTVDGFATHCGAGACERDGTCAAGVDTCMPGPPMVELCDGLDNDCDGTPDNPSPPGVVASLRVSRASLTWDAVAEASGYDVVRGDLVALHASKGDFATSTRECLADDIAVPTLAYALEPGAAEGWWLLVRAENCGGGGTYDSGDPRQRNSRDAGIAAAGAAACP